MSEGPPKPEDNERKVPEIEVVEETPPEDEAEELTDPVWADFDFGGDPELGIKGPGPETYVISPVTEEDLFSDKYINCTGLVGIGRKGNGRNIAFISHQDPEYFLNESNQENFIDDLKATLAELVAQSEDGTVEVVLFGGNIDKDDLGAKKTDDYKRSLEVLKKAVNDCIGQEPVIVREPRQEEGAIEVTVLTQERKIFIA